MHSSAGTAQALPALDVTLALRNDLQRFGVQHMASGLGEVGRVSCTPDPGATLHAAFRTPAADGSVLVLALADLGAELGLLRSVVEGGHRVLLLVDGSAPEFPRELPSLRGLGYADTSSLTADTLRAALTACAADDPPVPFWLFERIVLAWREEPVPSRAARPRITPREQQTLTLLVEGLSNRQIGRRLGISEHGAKRLVASLLSKLDCSNRTSAVALALRDGLCRPQSPTPPLDLSVG
ncbi:LuxR C-terminal-related transcriptional regulator [Streptomyces sp. NPDC060184]|uniref:helix-turn-helix transcriptional regulator n=1 Tax=Streptomyces sp. NPDC060184 TaxID=3347064 RepID=UPI00364D97E9